MKLNRLEKFGMNTFIHSIELRSVAKRALQLGGKVTNGNVLEIGCGGGLGVELIFDMFQPSHVEAFEFDPEQLGLAVKRLTKKYGDKIKLYEASATEIPANDNCFDAVFDFGVLHHIPDNQLALNEVSRVLKPNGRFFFQELFSSFTMNPIMKFLTHHPPEAQFTWKELSLKLTKSGLKISDSLYIATPSRVVGVAWKTTS